MNWKEVIVELTAGLQAGDLPRSRETVKDCIVHVLFKLLDEYVRTDSALSREIDALATAFGNRKDPALSDLNFAEHMLANGFVKSLRVMREANVGKKG